MIEIRIQGLNGHMDVFLGNWNKLFSIHKTCYHFEFRVVKLFNVERLWLMFVLDLHENWIVEKEGEKKGNAS